MSAFSSAFARSDLIRRAWELYCFAVLDAPLKRKEAFGDALMNILKYVYDNSGYIRGIAMTAKARTKATGKVAWVNRRLSVKELAAYDKQDVTSAAIFARMTELIFSGYSFAAKHDDYSGAVQVTLYDNGVQGQSSPMGMSSRSHDLWDAIAMTIYKHDIIFSEKWTADVPPPKLERG